MSKSYLPELPAGAWREIQPQTAVAALTAAGWVEAGRNTGCYVRLRAPFWPHTSVLVSLDQTAPEHERLMTGLLAELAAYGEAGQRATAALAALAGSLATIPEGGKDA